MVLRLFRQMLTLLHEHFQQKVSIYKNKIVNFIRKNVVLNKNTFKQN